MGLALSNEMLAETPYVTCRKIFNSGPLAWSPLPLLRKAAKHPQRLLNQHTEHGGSGPAVHLQPEWEATEQVVVDSNACRERY